MNRRLLIALPGLLLAAPVLAHTGHPDGGGLVSVVAHPFAGAEHLLAMLAVCLAAAWMRGRALWVLPVAFLATMMTGAALALAGAEWLLFQPTLSASVLLIGTASARAVRASATVAATATA